MKNAYTVAEKFHQQGVDVVINQWLVERANTPTVNSQSQA